MKKTTRGNTISAENPAESKVLLDYVLDSKDDLPLSEVCELGDCFLRFSTSEMGRGMLVIERLKSNGRFESRYLAYSKKNKVWMKIDAVKLRDQQKRNQCHPVDLNYLSRSGDASTHFFNSRVCSSKLKEGAEIFQVQDLIISGALKTVESARRAQELALRNAEVAKHFRLEDAVFPGKESLPKPGGCPDSWYLYHSTQGQGRGDWLVLRTISLKSGQLSIKESNVAFSRTNEIWILLADDLPLARDQFCRNGCVPISLDQIRKNSNLSFRFFVPGDCRRHFLSGGAQYFFPTDLGGSILLKPSPAQAKAAWNSSRPQLKEGLGPVVVAAGLYADKPSLSAFFGEPASEQAEVAACRESLV